MWEVGAEVGPETVVCIIEAMKVMNEIKAETRGVITSIVAENAKPVEFGQPCSASARSELLLASRSAASALQRHVRFRPYV